MIILYGATGYTGRLVARTLAGRGMHPVLAGRRAAALHEVADPLGLDVRVGGLDDISLAGATVLLNCAGPFARTQPPLLRACLAAGVHYLDLAGEVEEHRTTAARDADAKRSGILVLPGAGFGIVPSDTLSAHVAARLPDAVRIDVALKTVGGASRGTAEVVLGNLRTPGVQRRRARLVPARGGADRLSVDFRDHDGAVTVVTNPWRADLVGSVPAVPQLNTYMSFPAPVRAMMHIPHGNILRRVAARLPEGPSETALREGRTAVWCRATDRAGATATAVLHGPDAYLYTARTAEHCLRRVLDGDLRSGYHTPAGLWGPDFGTDVDDVTRHDLDPQ
jgi:saccharopine dehydrogenase (NAD+, L-lysine-forming)